MKLFRRSKPIPPERRSVPGLGRTTAYAYRANRLDEEATLGRHVFRDALEKRVKRKERRQLGRRLVSGLVLASFLAGAIYLLGLSTNPSVLPIDATQTPLLRPLSDYQRAAAAAMGSSIFNHNKLTVDTGAISVTLKRQFPELAVVSVALPLIGQQPTIYIAPADPVLALTTQDGHSYVVDSTGRAITAATPQLAAQLHLVPTKDMSGTPIKAGQRVLASSDMAFIQTILYQVHQKQLSVSLLVLPAASSEVDLYLTGQPYYGKFNLASGTALEQVGAFLATKHYLEGKGVTPHNYIDVRVDGRAYYQ